MRNVGIAALFVIAMLAGAGVGYFSGNGSVKTVTSTTTTPPNTLTFTSTATTTQTVTIQTNLSNTSEVCISNIANPPQSQYVAMLRQIIINPSFIQYSNGRCWTWEGTFEVTGPGYSNLNFVFDHFSETIIYPCGLFPAYEIDTRVYVVPSISSGNVTGVSIQPQSAPEAYSCPALTNTILPVWLNLVSWNSTGQTISLRLQYVFSNVSLRSLQAKISNSSWSYLIRFSQVNSTSQLQMGSYFTQEIFLAGAPLKPNVVYDMTATGTYANGAQTISNFKVQLQT